MAGTELFKDDVHPVFDILFKVNTTPGGAATLATIADMESFSIGIDGNVEEWTPMDTGGWVRRLATGKGFSISLSGKRNTGDIGNNYIASLAYVTGRGLNTNAEMVFPDGGKLEFQCVVNVTACEGGDSTGVSTLEFELMSNGAPTYTSVPKKA